MPTPIPERISPRLLHTLKALAKRGGLKMSIPIKSEELGRELGISQQTASKHILELFSLGLLERMLGTRNQMLLVTQKGQSVLWMEYQDYKVVFEENVKVLARGMVIGGLGEGRYYLNQEGYSKQFRKKLGIMPYSGTLNIRLLPSHTGLISKLRSSEGIDIEGFSMGHRTFGSVKCFPARIKDVECFLVFPRRSHYDDTLEVISAKHLRTALNLSDEDEVELEIEVS